VTVRRPRTTVQDVSTVVKRLVERDFAAAAKSNGVLSKVEQKTARAYVRAAADEVRRQKPGTLVKLDAMEAAVAPRTEALMRQLNQASGPGAQTLSQTEAKAAFKNDPVYGELILEAYEIASGNGFDVEALAVQYASNGLDPGETLQRFATLAEAERSSGPWLVRHEDGLLKNTYFVGKNDLWSQKFEVDRLTGAIAVTAEH